MQSISQHHWKIMKPRSSPLTFRLYQSLLNRKSGVMSLITRETGLQDNLQQRIRLLCGSSQLPLLASVLAPQVPSLGSLWSMNRPDNHFSSPGRTRDPQSPQFPPPSLFPSMMVVIGLSANRTGATHSSAAFGQQVLETGEETGGRTQGRQEEALTCFLLFTI